MPENYYKVLAKSPSELRVRSDHAEITIENIVLDAEVLLKDYSSEVESFALFETVYSNLSDFPLWTEWQAPVLIDSNCFQYKACALSDDAAINNSNKLEAGTKLPNVHSTIHGQARSRGWIAFPKLKKSLAPHRLIFEISLQKSDYTHIETLEFIFDLSLYGRLIKDSKTNRKDD